MNVLLLIIVFLAGILICVWIADEAQVMRHRSILPLAIAAYAVSRPSPAEATTLARLGDVAYRAGCGVAGLLGILGAWWAIFGHGDRSSGVILVFTLAVLIWPRRPGH